MAQRNTRGTAFPVLCLIASAAGLLMLPACGGGGGPTSVTPPTTQATPPPPRVVLSGSTAIRAGFAAGAFFSTDRVGTLDATVDYTHATSQITVWIATGLCTAEQFGADQCTIATTSFAGPKPRIVTLTGAAAGNYTLIVGNGGPNDEAISVQVVLTPSAGAASDEAATAASVRPDAWWSRRMSHP